MSENEYQEIYHFITSHPESVGRQMTHLIVGKWKLEVRVKQLEEELSNYACTCEKGYCAAQDGYRDHCGSTASALLNRTTQVTPND